MAGGRQHGRRTALALVAPCVLALALALVGCSGDDEDGGASGEPARPAPVALAVEGDGGLDVSIGVVITLRSAPGEGADQRFGASGAQVGAYRLSLGEADVDLEVVDDRGTARGARTAVTRLTEAGVSGIVVASAGRHLDAALQQASDAGVPTLLPYARTLQARAGVWTTGPGQQAVDSALLAALGDDGHGDPLVVTGDGVELEGVGSSDAVTYRAGRAEAVVDRALRAVEEGTVDSVVLGASAASLAELVSEFAGRSRPVPLYLSPEALSPAFPRALVEETQTLVGGMVAVGPDAGDTTTLSAGAAGDGAAAFFAALRLAAQDPSSSDLLGSGEFAAADADILSHDAVVALVRAAEEAGSTEPAAVAESLGSLVLDGGDGLAGPPLDFTDDQAMADDAVVSLVATTQDPGVRPATDGGAPLLFWFATGDQDAVQG